MSEAESVTELRYPLRSLLGDYLRAACGLGLGLGVLLFGPGHPVPLAIFGALALVFALFAVRTVERHLSRVAVSDSGVCRTGFGARAVAWPELSGLRLRYYGTRRDRTGSSGGFMELTLRGREGRLKLESSLPGFDYIAWRAARALRENGASTDPATAGNLLAIGIDADRDTPPPDLSGPEDDSISGARS